jgi:hypothetical protein
MSRTFFAASLLLPIVAACSGSGDSAPNAASREATVSSQTQSSAPVSTEAQVDATVKTQWQYTSSPADLLYVGNTGNNSITVYRHDASGNAAPLRVIIGSKTGIGNPGQLSEDAQGNLYVANSIANDVANASPAILVFAHGANGNVAPIRTLAGAHTSLHHIGAMTVDVATGKIFAVDSEELCPGSVSYNFFCATSLLRFPPNAAGNTAPFARSAFGNMLAGIEIASDSTGQNIIEAHTVAAPENRETGIDTFAKQFPNGAAIGSLFDIAGFIVNGVTADPTTKTYLASEGTSIYRLKEETHNNFGFSLTPAPVQTFNTNVLCGQLALGYLRNIYAVCGSAVNVYTPTATGNATPLRVLTGSATKLNKPYGIYEGQ